MSRSLLLSCREARTPAQPGGPNPLSVSPDPVQGSAERGPELHCPSLVVCSSRLNLRPIRASQC
ncbi:hypothetical protein EQM14_11675 [Caproiciproducens sp. NJN-50]|uniref:hypothetical protein n=1 Tax=Acutalibacteraceae TaxID=3082771 RepID=UPI000FFE0F77|nr:MULTISPECIES: hypothetical protein [Acutalibacteraceae]QAT50366.1 hypothetical protein EQM14_11675 [Caproiciproducens sp. NJN-50]